jgi:hypothetical protein
LLAVTDTDMPEAITIVTAILTALGVGSALGAYFQVRFQYRSKIGEQEHELKQRRYLCILILMLTKMSPTVGLEKVRAIRPDLTALQDVEDELSTELLNAIVFASQAVLESLAAFIRSPSNEGFVAVASAMRKDLWGKRATVGADLVALLPLSRARAVTANTAVNPDAAPEARRRLP